MSEPDTKRQNLPAARQIGGDVQVSALGFGAAPIGNLYAPVPEEEAMAAVHAALAGGISFFDTAPYYGYGLSESRLGRALAGQPRGTYAISTKVGRRLQDEASAEPGRHGFAVGGRDAVFDYSRDGVLKSFESSLERLQTDHVDILLLHDIGRLTHGDDHPARLRQALDEALPAMAELKAAGACRAIGIGVNEEDICLELMPLFPLDCIMLAGRYTLLEQQNSRRVMEEAQRRSVAILAAGPYNSGLLANADRPGDRYNYEPANTEILERAQHIYAICHAHGVDTGAAALQFPLSHPVVATVVAGMRSADEARSAITRIGTPLAAALWQQLREEGLLSASATVPA
ncbi:aldo/keto reductase [Pseudoxanthomonas sp. UTMC 1351]|uniref:aldo/keto reductase n=1 Tax=Pseudoxanthomonas sp. UTMC 1351 TaxID=2695853 RepID=UPI0034CDC8C6